MINLSNELLEKVKQAKSYGEIVVLAKENGIEMTEEQAKAAYAQLVASCEISDDELENVSGGLMIPFNVNNEEDNIDSPIGDENIFLRITQTNLRVQCSSDRRLKP